MITEAGRFINAMKPIFTSTVRTCSSYLSAQANKYIEQLDLRSQTDTKPTTHVVIQTPKDFDHSLRDTFWTRTLNASGVSELTKVPNEVIKDYNILAFGGLGFYKLWHLSALLKSAGKLSPTSLSLKSAAVFHDALFETRYHSAKAYNADKLYCAPYIENFTRKYVLPRFLDSNGILTEPAKPLLFFTFSVGGREVMMVENCLRTIFEKEYKCSPINIYQLFTHLSALSIGYALDYNNLPALRFSKVVVFSIDELGVERTKALAKNVVFRTPSYIAQEVSFSQCKHLPLTSPTCLITFNHGTVPPITGKMNITEDFHSLTHYTSAIEKNPEVLSIIGEFVSESTILHDTI